LAAIGNTAAGLIYSPITSPVKLRVVGAGVTETPEIEAILRSLEGQPALLVDKNLLVARSENTGAIKDAKISLNIFGRGTLVLDRQKPVASVAGSPESALAENGEVYEFGRSFENIPQVAMPREWSEPSASVVSIWEKKQLVRLCKEVKRRFPGNRWTVSVARTGHFSLESRDGLFVNLCSSYDLDDKVEQLAILLARQPDLSERYEDLTIVGLGQPIAGTPKK
jgi:hypothetical protein